MSADNNFPEYVITTTEPAPPDYPFELTPDEFSTQPFEPDYKARRDAYLQFVLNNPAPTNIKSPFYELVRLAAGGTPHPGILYAAMNYIDSRLDCADVPLHSILRMLYQFGDNPQLDSDLLGRARESILNFKYWPDEPGIDSMCTWTENHFILFSSGAYLAGQLYPDQVFKNSSYTGEKMMATHRSRILRWMNLRFFTGFSEWLSHIYYDEDLTALLSLVEFCQDDEIKLRASIIVDLLLFEMAAHNFSGVFGSSHGSSYEESKKWSAKENTTDTQKLLFGRGIFAGDDNMSAAAFVLSEKYRMPEVIFKIANDQERKELLHRQRVGILLDEASWWDLKPKNFENGMHLLTLEAYFTPQVINLFVKMLNSYNWWENRYFNLITKHRRLLNLLRRLRVLPFVSRIFKHDLSRTTRDEVNLYTFRTPDYMLSTAQDYRRGLGGDQQHIWQATLGPNAICFTTHPARKQGPTPNYWAGSGTLPRVAQIRNVVIAIYRISKAPSILVKNELFYTHAWLPRDQFEEIVEQNGWIFARYGDGYLALKSQHPYEWRTLPGEDQNRELIVHHRNNIWLCELGRAQDDNSFLDFMDKISNAQLNFSDLNITYQSPSLGVLDFGWNRPLRLDGKSVQLDNYPRYASPYIQAEFPPESIIIELEKQVLDLDWLAPRRSVSKYV